MSIFAQRTTQTTTQIGTVPEGFLFASFKNLGTQSVEVDGVPLEPGEAYSIPFVGRAYESPVSYDPNSQPLRIMFIH